MTVTSLVELILSFALILGGAVVFVNGIEWLGKKLKLTEGAVGSVLAAVGTAMPESMIPVVALLTASNGDGRAEVGVGAILGAPLLLATVAMGISGIAVYIFSRRNGRPIHILADSKHVRRDLSFFIIAYTFAIFLAIVPLGQLARILAVVLLVGFFAFFVWRTVTSGEHVENHDLEGLYLSPKAADPSLALIIIQLVGSLGLLIGGAHVFVTAVEQIAHAVGVPALVLALVIAPLATELPEKLNSVLWIRQSKDTLALGNITGAMVFQSTLPVALGVAFTPWHLTGAAMLSAVLALAAAMILWVVFKREGTVGPVPLLISGLLYVVFLVYVLTV